ILSEACTKLRESRDQLVDATNDIEEKMSRIFAKVLGESLKILPADDLYKKIQESIQYEPTSIFDLTSIDKFIRIKNVLESLRKLNKRLKKLFGNASYTQETYEVLSDNSSVPDEDE
ncbi:hypothetical protein KI387_007605, partial [Taxus chinensis]